MVAGKFIVVEGLEGAGKSTAIQTIKDCLDTKNIKVLFTREPGGTIIGEKIRTMIKEESQGAQLHPISELLLMYAARVQLCEEVIKPALKNGIWVVADRFELSTYAYQGGGRKLDKATIDLLSQICMAGFKPDGIIFLDINPADGLLRIKSRGQLDRIEQESIKFFNDVYQAYHQQIKSMNNVTVIDAGQPIEKVQALIVEQLNNLSRNA